MQNRYASGSSLSPLTSGTPLSDVASNNKSDDDLELFETGSQAKKPRRTPGACDTCRRKKIRCDSTQTADNICTNCKSSGIECTHKAVGKSLGAAKGYVESLEARLEKMDKLLTTLLPGFDFNKELEKLENQSQGEPDTLPRNDGDYKEEEIHVHLAKLKLDPENNRFFGKSSHLQLIQTALDVKGQLPKKAYTAEDESWKRDGFWEIPEWADAHLTVDQWAGKPTYNYPPEDLMHSLIDLYFTYVNVYLALLHRPTFENQVSQGLHHINRAFGATLLLVCAHGAKYSNDNRVVSEGTNSWLSSGYKYFSQVKVLRESGYEKASLYELQAFALHATYASGTYTVQGVWLDLGVALRLAVEVGAHRKRYYPEPTAENELWKRAFWVLLVMDRRLSSMNGRGVGLHEEEIDLDYPVECDDEYWDKGFKQPEGVPSKIAFMNSYLRLSDILSQAMRFIYSIKRPQNLFFNGTARSDHELIAELDSRMNKWMDSVPAHLKWHQKHDNDLFRKQSACLHAYYYHLQIFIHRPFVPSPRNPSPSSFPSLAICTNAARSCCHVLETFLNGPTVPLTFEVTFNTGLILMLNIWSGRRSGYAPNPKRELEGVSRCMQILHDSEERWMAPGRFKDVIHVLYSLGGQESVEELNRLTLKKRTRKRARDDSQMVGITVEAPEQSMFVQPTNEPRPIAGSARVSRNIQDHPSPASSDEQSAAAPNYPLPTSTNELGRLPIFGQFNFLDDSNSLLTNPAPSPPGSNSPVNPNSLPNFDIFGGNVFSPDFLSNIASTSAGHQQNSSQSDTNSMMNMLSYNIFVGQPAPPTNPQQTFDADMMRMWSSAPANISVDDWTSYLTNFQNPSSHQSHNAQQQFNPF